MDGGGDYFHRRGVGGRVCSVAWKCSVELGCCDLVFVPVLRLQVDGDEEGDWGSGMIAVAERFSRWTVVSVVVAAMRRIGVAK